MVNFVPVLDQPSHVSVQSVPVLAKTVPAWFNVKVVAGTVPTLFNVPVVVETVPVLFNIGSH